MGSRNSIKVYNTLFKIRKGFLEKPIVAFTNITVFILNFYMTKPVWSHVLASSAFEEAHIVSCHETRLQISACKANSPPTELSLPNHT